MVEVKIVGPPNTNVYEGHIVVKGNIIYYTLRTLYLT